jgi:diguanylate cyclase (GGDEF)-like protein
MGSVRPFIYLSSSTPDFGREPHSLDMNLISTSRHFSRSKSGRWFLLYLSFCALVSSALGYGIYQSSVSWFKTHKSEEKIVALRLVDAFVTNYSAIRSQFGSKSPVPATFRAHSIASFNKDADGDDDFRLRWVGRKGREILTPPSDDKTAEVIESFATASDPKPASEFLTANNQLVFRTVYPSLAREQSCVDCHNAMQPSNVRWRLNDVMGAFVIDVPASPFFDAILIEASGLSLALFLALSGVGFAFSFVHFRQMNEREVAQERIAHLAHHDVLTGLPNRSVFSEQLETTVNRCTSTGGSFALLSLNLDRFKEINDVFGHSVGDALLQEVARRMHVVAEGAFLARLGSDEFTIIAVQGPNSISAAALAERLLAAVTREMQIEAHKLHVGVSIGVAIFPGDGAAACALVANANAALYRAKAEGRGAIRFFEPEMDMQLREGRLMQQELQSALDRGELFLDYQPQALVEGEIVGFEALLRWRSPTRGIVSPAKFIPLAEEDGLIIPIGEWILREACREAASWPRSLQIAVNLSPVQFRHGDLPSLVQTVLLETGLSPSRLELEITEGVLIDNFSRVVSILRRLKLLGVRIAMDDFGTGYSSLSYLQSFPFDKIKIDRAFVANLNQNPQSAAIIRTVIALGRGLQLPVVAEGVETKDQLAFLSRESCDQVQGYLIGHPRAIEDYADTIGRKSARQKLMGGKT